MNASSQTEPHLNLISFSIALVLLNRSLSAGCIDTLRLEANRLEDRVADGICDLRNDFLYTFVVDCPVEVRGVSGTEIFGVVCDVPACCTECVNQR